MYLTGYGTTSEGEWRNPYLRWLKNFFIKAFTQAIPSFAMYCFDLTKGLVSILVDDWNILLGTTRK